MIERCKLEIRGGFREVKWNCAKSRGLQLEMMFIIDFRNYSIEGGMPTLAAFNHLNIYFFLRRTRAVHFATQKGWTWSARNGHQTAFSLIKDLFTNTKIFFNGECRKLKDSWKVWRISILLKPRSIMICEVYFANHCSTAACPQKRGETSSTTSFSNYSD